MSVSKGAILLIVPLGLAGSLSKPLALFGFILNEFLCLLRRVSGDVNGSHKQDVRVGVTPVSPEESSHPATTALSPISPQERISQHVENIKITLFNQLHEVDDT